MSHEIVKRIRVDNGQVFLTSASNNVSPRHFKEWHCESLTKILQEQGRDALDVEILEQYEGWMFRGPDNKYTRALKVLRHMPEYKDFDWRVNFGEEWDKIQENRTTPAFAALLTKAMNTQLPLSRFVVSREWAGRIYYLQKRKTCGKWTHLQGKATVFRYYEDAQAMWDFFAESDKSDWSIKAVTR